MIYINKNINFYEMDQELPDSYFIGTTIEDYYEGAFLLLNKEQEELHLNNPKASPLEIWNLNIVPEPVIPEYIPESPKEDRSLYYAKEDKKAEIRILDAQSNKFFISVIKEGVEIQNQQFWINSSMRTTLLTTTLPTLLLNGETVTKLWTNDYPRQSVTVPIKWAQENLALLELYAKKTYDKKAENEVLVEKAETIEEVQAIDVKLDYPEVLTFILNLDV